MIFLDLLYAVLLLCAFPFWVKYIFRKNYRRLLKDRLRPQLPARTEKTIWIHAVSVGEVRSLKSLIHNLHEKSRPVILSVTTPSGFEFARKEYPSLPVIHSPFDLSFVVRRFIRAINPQLVVFNELEIWPNWISLLHRKKIPMLLINGRISESAFSRYRFFSSFMWRFFKQIDCFLVQNELYKKRFQRLGIPAEKILVCGNIKADEADRNLKNLPARSDVLAHLRLDPPAKKIIVLASSHGSSEKIVFPAIGPLSDRFFFIIVPRHVQRAATIARQLERLGLSCSLFSAAQPIQPGLQALIYDRMGYLIPIMSIADMVFMGGTHDPKIGGHNLYEPAAMGKLILGGPCFNNFPDIGGELASCGAYRQIQDSDALVDFAGRLQGLDLQQISQKARKAVLNRRGSLACTLEQIQRFVG